MTKLLTKCWQKTTGNKNNFSVLNPKPDRNSNLGIETEENPMKKIKKKFDRIMNPMPRDDNDPVEVEYKIMCNIERRVKE